MDLVVSVVAAEDVRFQACADPAGHSCMSAGAYFGSAATVVIAGSAAAASASALAVTVAVVVTEAGSAAVTAGPEADSAAVTGTVLAVPSAVEYFAVASSAVVAFAAAVFAAVPVVAAASAADQTCHPAWAYVDRSDPASSQTTGFLPCLSCAHLRHL